MVVEGLGRLAAGEGRGDGRVDELSGGGFSVGSDDGDNGNVEGASVCGGGLVKGGECVVCVEKRECDRIGVGLANEGGGGTGIGGGGEVIVAIGFFGGECDEDVAGLEGAGVDGEAGDLCVGIRWEAEPAAGDGVG